MTTLKAGIASYDDYKARTLAIARGDYKPTGNEPKIWFTSIESFARILSDRNRELLNVIATTRPESVTELARTTGRAVSNLSRTLKTMESCGLVTFEQRPGRERAPRVAFSEIELEMRLTIGPQTHARRTAA